MTVLKIAAILLIVTGAVINYGAGYIVKRLALSQRVAVKEAHEFTGEALEEYKRMKALSMVKLVGLFTLIPGVVLIFIAFK
ncbi:MAG: hypothetical protein GX384_03550 [Clostridiaceae bacterium]|jgi:hypothetical protein|nr:hypothetical protein [Bacillota bacterium]NLI38404.1 hypothetical protein [Clostridiaceae bacterium]